MKVNFKAIGLRIKEVRTDQGMSQAELAELVDISVQYVSQIERAKKQISLAVLIETANALGSTVDSLLAGSQENDGTAFHSDIIRLMDGCNNFQKRIVLDVATATKKSLMGNDHLQEKEERW